MKNTLTFLFISLLLLHCSSTTSRPYVRPTILSCPQIDLGITEISTDTTYGISLDNPIKVGGGPDNEHKYLKMLSGPIGGPIEILSRSSNMGKTGPMIDIYSILLIEDSTRIDLFLNMYDCDDPKAPIGFKIKK